MAKSEHNFVLNREDKFDRIRTALEKFQESSEKTDYIA
jgi:hypothetical protein